LPPVRPARILVLQGCRDDIEFLRCCPHFQDAIARIEIELVRRLHIDPGCREVFHEIFPAALRFPRQRRDMDPGIRTELKAAGLELDRTDTRFGRERNAVALDRIPDRLGSRPDERIERVVESDVAERRIDADDHVVQVGPLGGFAEQRNTPEFRVVMDRLMVEYRITVRPGSMRIDGYRRSVFLDRRLASGAGERDAQTEESEHQLAHGDPEVREAFHVRREAGSPNHVQHFRFPSSHRTRNRVQLAGRSAGTGLASAIVAD
jgi:hypothetical protein